MTTNSNPCTQCYTNSDSDLVDALNESDSSVGILDEKCNESPGMGSEWTDKECQTCSVCMTSVTASVNADERTRLLGSRQDSDFYVNLFFIGVLFLLLCAGVGIGTYLLFNEDHEWQQEGVYSVIPRDEWGAVKMNNSTFRNLALPVGKVLLVETKTPPCNTKGECLEDVRELQRLHLKELPDIGFNFLVGGDGRIYEGRGWYYQCEVQGYIDEDTLTIGVLGSFTTDPPKDNQVNEIQILLDYAKRKGILRKCYSVIIRRSATSNVRILLDVAAQLQQDESFDC